MPKSTPSAQNPPKTTKTAMVNAANFAKKGNVSPKSRGKHFFTAIIRFPPLNCTGVELKGRWLSPSFILDYWGNGANVEFIDDADYERKVIETTSSLIGQGLVDGYTLVGCPACINRYYTQRVDGGACPACEKSHELFERLTTAKT